MSLYALHDLPSKVLVQPTSQPSASHFHISLFCVARQPEWTKNWFLPINHVSRSWSTFVKSSDLSNMPRLNGRTAKCQRNAFDQLFWHLKWILTLLRFDRHKKLNFQFSLAFLSSFLSTGFTSNSLKTNNHTGTSVGAAAHERSMSRNKAFVTSCLWYELKWIIGTLHVSLYTVAARTFISVAPSSKCKWPRFLQLFSPQSPN